MGDAPGVCCIVFDGEGEILVIEQGHADLRRSTPFEAGTRSRWFSVTKLVTALAVLRLVEEGRLSLEDRVADRLSFFRPAPASPAVTIEHLLSHAGGLDAPLPLGWLHRKQGGLRSSAELTRHVFSRHHRLRSPPGAEARYTNLGYLLLGEVIASASGASYAQEVERSVLSKLGLRSTGFDPTPCAIGHERWPSLRAIGMGLAFVGRVGVAYVKSGWIGLDPFVLEGEAYGGLAGSTRDMARLGRALLREGELDGVRLLDRELVREMRRPRSATFGLGPWCLGGGWLGHTGEAGGYRAELRWHPSQGIGAAVLATSGTAPVERIARSAIARARE